MVRKLIRFKDLPFSGYDSLEEWRDNREVLPQGYFYCKEFRKGSAVGRDAFVEPKIKGTEFRAGVLCDYCGRWYNFVDYPEREFRKSWKKVEKPDGTVFEELWFYECPLSHIFEAGGVWEAVD